MKRRIAVLSSASEYGYLTNIIKDLHRIAQSSNIDLYVFTCYQYKEHSGFTNRTGYYIYNLINYADFDGVIVIANTIYDNAVLERERQRILQSGKPAVSIGKKMEGIPFIHLDNTSGFFRLIEHLITQHKVTKMVFIGGPDSEQENKERIQAFTAAARKRGIPIFSSNMYLNGSWEYSYGYETAKKIFAKPREEWPQAIVCANDNLALAAMKVAKENDVKIPEQIKIVGFDDASFSASVIPSLSTVNGNSEQVTHEAFKKLLSGDRTPNEVRIMSKPVLRQSCGCPVNITQAQIDFATQDTSFQFEFPEFTNHMRQLEDVFLQSQSTYALLQNMNIFFQRSHKFEGSDFCILLNSEWSSILINSKEELGEYYSFGKQVNSIVNIKNNKKSVNEIINTKDLIPESMYNPMGSNIYLFIPLYNHTFMHGYAVIKNNLAFLHAKQAYTFTRTFGSNIERFRQKNMYKLLSQQYIKLSTTDGLSGLKNRVALERLAVPFYEQNKKLNLQNILIFVDINKMKHINDNFGHLHGDLAIKTVADSISSVIPKGWMGIRYGGDEFVVIGNSRDYHGEDFCSMIDMTLKEKTSKMKLPYNLSVSLGTLTFGPESTLTLQQAIDKVDEVMYEKKIAFHKEAGDQVPGQSH